MRSTKPKNNEPVYSAQTLLRRISQKDDRIPSVIPDGIYDPQTQSAVTEFQRNYGLEPTGIIDNDTWDKLVDTDKELNEPLYRPDVICLNEYRDTKISPGQTADCLYPIQGMMYVLTKRFSNLGPIEITGVHNEDSTDFARKIQEIALLEIDGIINVKTYNVIARLYEIFL